MRAVDSEEVAIPRRADRRWWWLAVVLVLAVVVTPLSLWGKPELARGRTCLSNVKSLNLHLMMYAEDADGRYPPACTWSTTAEPYLKNTMVALCPSDPSLRGIGAPLPAHVAVPTSYTMNQACSGFPYKRIELPSEVAVLFDGNGPCGGPDHAELRHPRDRSPGLNVGFVDGHVKWLSAEDFAKTDFKP
ncbi:MAG TPA: hypothetical protein VGM19_11380 [Armatimonadota bacterium]|jgi:prepilin-type processing-associated H-X9-DG protein